MWCGSPTHIRVWNISSLRRAQLSHYNGVISNCCDSLSWMCWLQSRNRTEDSVRWLWSGGCLIFCHLPRLISCFIPLRALRMRISQHLLPLRSHYDLRVSLDTKLSYRWGCAFRRTTNVVVLALSGASEGDGKCSGSLNTVLRHAATLSHVKCVGMFISAWTNYMPSEQCCQV
jgi:hypothetical protein